MTTLNPLQTQTAMLVAFYITPSGDIIAYDTSNMDKLRESMKNRGHDDYVEIGFVPCPSKEQARFLASGTRQLEQMIKYFRTEKNLKGGYSLES